MALRSSPLSPVPFIVAGLLLVGGVFTLWWCQRMPPVEVTLLEEVTAIGPATNLPLSVRAHRGGVRWIEATLEAGAQSVVLGRQEYEASTENQREWTVSAAAFVDELPEGPATLVVRAADGFFRPLGASDEPALEIPVVIDRTPPRLTVRGGTRYPTQGGSGVVVLQRDADAAVEIQVGDRRFPAYATNAGLPHQLVAFYAIPFDYSVNERIRAQAVDAAGNVTSQMLSVVIRDKKYERGTVNLRREFLVEKIAELLPGTNTDGEENLATAFLTLNRDQRAQAAQVKRDLARDTQPGMLWRNAFVQPRNTRVFSNFAETRAYRLGGVDVDTQVHLGFDLASVKQAAIPAANSGVVIYARPLNIYGNTVVLDHGLGLQSLYAHMTSLNVTEGEAVGKEQVLGHSGTTGLAVGDHLHYEVLVQGYPVNPLEWWDEQWVRSHVLEPLSEAGIQANAAR